jgi:hypothetical protein
MVPPRPPAFREFVLSQYSAHTCHCHTNDENCGVAVKALKHASPPRLQVSVDIGDSPNVDSTFQRCVVVLRYMTRHSGDY